MNSLRGSEHGNRFSASGTTVLTWTGQSVELTGPDPDTIQMVDIALGLGHLERFVGACPLRPTVAQHSLAVAHIADVLYLNQRRDALLHGPTLRALRRAALMHDSAEYLLGDLIGAVKMLMRPELRGAAGAHSESPRARMSAYDRLEERIQSVIVDKFGCSPAGFEECIHEADELACAYEMRDWEPLADVPGWMVGSFDLANMYRARPGAFLLTARDLGMVDFVPQQYPYDLQRELGL